MRFSSLSKACDGHVHGYERTRGAEFIDKDEEGYINKMTIERTVSQFEVSSFNSGLELYAGSSNGMITTNVLDKIITSNKTEEELIELIKKKLIIIIPIIIAIAFLYIFSNFDSL